MVNMENSAGYALEDVSSGTKEKAKMSVVQKPYKEVHGDHIYE